MKVLKKSLLSACLLLTLASSGFAQPAFRMGPAGFNIHHIDMRPNNPAFGHMSPIIDHDGWNHYNGGLWHGPHYDIGGAPWGWYNGGWSRWPAGAYLGQPIAVTPISCGC
ncbi:MAG: hypothetical protein WCK49_08840 [Myxococcaceae bacterium]